MLEGPIGAAAFNNEFGRPNICGYFRTLRDARCRATRRAAVRGYHKPIMLAGGLGNVRRAHVEKGEVSVGAHAGGAGRPGDADRPGRRRGLLARQRRVRARSSISPRCSAATPRCSGARRKSSIAAGRWARDNPIELIHDVGAGGLSNAVPEAVAHSQRGARIELRAIPNAEPGMSPLEIWCNEAQERYVLALEPGSARRASRDRASASAVRSP